MRKALKRIEKQHSITLKVGNLVAQEHHILRLNSENNVEKVFQRKKYFSAMTSVNGWQQGSTVIFLKKFDKKDSVIGYGIIDNIKKLDDMSEEEKEICKETDNKFVLSLDRLAKLNPPKPIKETAIGKWGIYGKVLHGRSLSDQELRTALG